MELVCVQSIDYLIMKEEYRCLMMLIFISATSKGSIWRDRISLAILELQEKGTIQILYDKWWKNTGNNINKCVIIEYDCVFCVVNNILYIY